MFIKSFTNFICFFFKINILFFLFLEFILYFLFLHFSLKIFLNLLHIRVILFFILNHISKVLILWIYIFFFQWNYQYSKLIFWDIISNCSNIRKTSDCYPLLIFFEVCSYKLFLFHLIMEILKHFILSFIRTVDMILPFKILIILFQVEIL